MCLKINLSLNPQLQNPTRTLRRRKWTTAQAQELSRRLARTAPKTSGRTPTTPLLNKEVP